ncbi:MAG: pilus assembly protein [Micrococcales bacterium]|nr:pilus assembly protein [Micrococcales bacterium]
MRSERGGVTVELALVLPAVVALAAFLVALGSAALSQIRCADAARAGAREAALGTDDAGVLAVAQQLAGQEARVGVERTGGLVEVTVERPVLLLGRVFSASARAVTACEPARGCGWQLGAG